MSCGVFLFVVFLGDECFVLELRVVGNNEGDIIHVGIIMENHHIIHAHGKVRIDRIDHSGIYNVDTKTHSHKLRVIKSIV